MTQARLIAALQDGPKTTHELAELTGMTNSTIGSTAKKLRYKGELSVEYVKVGRYNLAKYTLTNPEPLENDKTIICGIKTYGIFTPAEYKVMNAQARRHMNNVNLLKGISSNQKI